MRPLFPLKAALMVVALSVATSLSGQALDPLPHIEAQGHQLLVDGKPFVIKGVCYNPVPKGGTYPANLITQHPTEQDLAIIKQDFEMMHAAGINTIRTYTPITDKKILKLLNDNQLKTIVPIRNTYFIGLHKLAATVAALKNDPTTLIWEIGNECNLNHFYTQTPALPQGISDSDCISFIKKTASHIKKLDSTHPVSVDLGVVPTYASILSHNADIELYGLNYYNGLTCTQSYDNTWPELSKKPLYLSEFGASAYNLEINKTSTYTNFYATAIEANVLQLDLYYLYGILPISLDESNHIYPGAIPGGAVFGEDENAQADGITALVTDIKKHLSANDPHNNLLGGCIFEWTDEWWKAAWKKTPQDFLLHSIFGYCCSDANGLIAYGPYPDHFFHEEWFGLLTVDRVPRASYFALQKLYSE